jgi:hypothetical protein
MQHTRRYHCKSRTQILHLIGTRVSRYPMTVLSKRQYCSAMRPPNYSLTHQTQFQSMLLLNSLVDSKLTKLEYLKLKPMLIEVMNHYR